ncbi:Asx homology domain-containing protein [Xylariaceae sp. FL1019]|nr:Asx homology domain-containing protein [Xylariaceae sp. FL1019]
MPPRKKSGAGAASRPLRKSMRTHRQSALQQESEADDLAQPDMPTTSHPEQVLDESTIMAHPTDRSPSENRRVAEQIMARYNKIPDFSKAPIPRSEEMRASKPSLAARRGIPIKKQNFEVATTAAEEEDELSGPTPKRAKPVAKATQYGSWRKGRSKWDNPDEMLTNEKAPLAFTDLRDLLCNPMAWQILSDEEKQKVLSQFPDDTEIEDAGTSNARPNIMALRNNNNFRHDVARYQEGLKDGQHDMEWIQQAQAAHSKRGMGFYDDFLASDFKEKWDLAYPEHLGQNSAAQTNGLSTNNDGQFQPTADATVKEALMRDEPEKTVAQSPERTRIRIQDIISGDWTTPLPAPIAMGIETPSSRTEHASDQPPYETMQGIQGAGADHEAQPVFEQTHLLEKFGS